MQEELIVHGLKIKDEYYLEMSMKLYGKLVQFVIKKMLGPNDLEAVEELASDTFLTIWQKAELIDLEKGSLKNLLCLIARNLTINYLKQNRKNKEHLVSFEDHNREEVAAYYAVASLPAPDATLLSAESVSEILKIINRLKEPDNQIFMLRYLYELEIEEIAKLLHMKRKQVDNHLSRGRKRLRLLMFQEKVPPKDLA